LALGLASPGPAHAQATALLKDINPTGDSNPQFLTRVGNVLFFAADDGVNGVELWRSDGSSGGTFMVQNIATSGASSNPHDLTAVGGVLFFAATDATGDTELWKSDAGGTAPVKNINPSGSSSPTGLVDLGGVLYFAATDAAGTELWKSDGTDAGTVRVLDINAGAGSSSPTGLTKVGGLLYFAATDAAGTELWKSDGTAGGTVMVRDINAAGGSSPQGLTDVAGTLFFSADDGATGRELWKSDGTSGGTVLVRDIFTGAGNSADPGHLTGVNGTLFFAAGNSANNRELWKSDGTTAGTVVVRNILNPGSSNPHNLKALNGTLYFAATDGVQGVELFKSDGTSAGTVIVRNLDNTPSGGNPGDSFPAWLTEVFGSLYFVAYGELQEEAGPNGEPIGRELWKSDGTGAGTILVADIFPDPVPDPLNPPPHDVGGPSEPTLVSGALFFAADDGVNGRELWAIPGADLSISLAAIPGPLSLGESFSYTLDIANAGPPTADDVVATLTLSGPAAVASTIPGSPACAAAPTSVSCSLGPLAFGNVTSVQVVAQSTGAGVVTGQAGVASANPDLNPANDAASALTTVFPLIQVNDLSVVEGNSGSTNAAFVVTVFPGSTQTVTVDFSTSNGTATAGSDYTGQTGSLTFGPGVATQTVNVSISGDTTPEPDETILLSVSNPVNAFIGDAQGVATILDDEQTFLTIADAPTVTEGNAGTTAVTFSVTLNEPPVLPVTVTWATANGTATAPADYQGASGALSFAATTAASCIPALCERTFTVNVVGDLLDEYDETFLVNLGVATNAVVADGLGVGVIADDDVAPTLSIADVALTEGNSGTTSAVFSVTLSNASGRGVTVDWMTANGTATSGQDYVASSGTLVFQPGVSVQLVSVPVLGDGLDEPLESFVVNLSSPVNATIADGQATGSIADDDPAPGVSVGDVTVIEGDAGAVSALFQVTLASPSGQQATVDFTTGNGTALAGSDYTTTSGTLTFPAGTVTRTLSVPVLGDDQDEPTESFSVTLTGAVNASIVDGAATGTIVDNDTAHISIGDATLTEGDAGSSQAVFTASLSKAANQTISVSYATVNGSAVAPSDYQAVSGGLTFSPGVTSATIGVNVLGDLAGEADETFSVVLGSPVNVVIGDGGGVGTILNDDTMAGVSISDVTLSEGNAGSSTASFVVQMAFPAGGPVTVGYATSNGSAKSGVDYVGAQGTLTILTGNSEQTLSVSVLGDIAAEPNETFLVALTGASGAVVDDGLGQATILDDDGAGTLQFDKASVSVNEVGTAKVTVARLGSTKGAVSVGYATVDGTAEAGADYQAVAGTLSFKPGQRSQSISVPLILDTEVEGDETLLLRLFNATGGATLGPIETARLVIRDNEQPGRLQFGMPKYSASEGGTAVVTVKRLSGSAGAVSVTYLASDGTAQQPGDYAPTSGVLSFLPGQVAASFSVAIGQDGLSEGSETFSVALSNPTGFATLGAPATTTVTITDDEPTVAFGAANIKVPEISGPATIALKRVGDTSGAFSVSFATSPGSLNPATAGLDYTPVVTNVDFGPGVASSSVVIGILGDSLDELDETVRLTATPAGGTPVQATLTIGDNDTAGSVRFTAATARIAEDAGSLVLTVSRAGGTASFAVDYATQDGTAIATSDYDASSGTLNFGASQVSQTISIPIQNDAVAEGDESFNVVLQNPQGRVVLGNPAAVAVTIADSESALSFSAPDVSVGEAGKTVTLTVRRSGPTGGTVMVGYTTANGTAQAPADYTAVAAGSLTFGPGVTSRTLKVTIINDALVEADEAFSVTLGAPTGGAALGVPATTDVTIVDNEGPGTLQLSAAAYKVNEIGPQAVITVQRSGGTGGSVSVDYQTADGSAEDGLDYATASGTLTFGPGISSLTIGVPITSDTEDEGSETLTISLSNPSGSPQPPSIGARDSAEVTIQDDDSGGAVAFSSSVFSAGEGAGVALVTVVRTGGSSSGAQVNYATSPGTASVADFQAVSGTLVFEAGITSLTIEVPIQQDLLQEGGETIALALSSPGGGATLGPVTTAVLWVVDDE
jgi:ELWxxDGT repeat protein